MKADHKPISGGVNWKEYKNQKPIKGDRVLVKMITGDIYYAIYSDVDEFDIHMPGPEVKSRLSWYKHSSRSIDSWRYFCA